MIKHEVINYSVINMGQYICRMHELQDESWTEESVYSISERKIENRNFRKYVANGDVKNVELMICGGYCDVNAGGYHNGEYKRPLLIALKSIQEENDFFFQIAQMLLDCKDVDVNAEVHQEPDAKLVIILVFSLCL